MKVRTIGLSPNEFLAGTTELSDAEMGVYFRLFLLTCSSGGPVTKDRLKSVCRSHGNAFNAILVRLKALGEWSGDDRQMAANRAENVLEKARKRIAKLFQFLPNEKEINNIEEPYGGISENHNEPTSRPPFAPPSPPKQKITPSPPPISPPLSGTPPLDSPPQAECKNGPAKTKQDIADWQPNTRHYELAAERGCDERWLADQAERYADWLRNLKGNRKHTDFDAGFRNWVKRAADEHRGQSQSHYGGNGQGLSGGNRSGPPSFAQAMFEVLREKTTH